MNSFLVQVQSEGYSTIIQNRSYYNVHWKRKAGGYKSKMWESRNNIDHGKVKSGDRLLVYCGSQVPNMDHKGLLAFSVYVSSVSDDNTFELGEPQLFRNPLAYKAIREHIEQGELDNIFSNCGKTGFNITKLEPIAVEQILNIVEPKSPLPPPPQDRHQTVLGRVWRAILAAVRHLRGRFQRRDRGGEA